MNTPVQPPPLCTRRADAPRINRGSAGNLAGGAYALAGVRPRTDQRAAALPRIVPSRSRAEYFRAKRKNDPEGNRRKNAAWKAKNREKYLAHKAIENALRANKLERQPCLRCGATELVHAHHDNYSQQLTVMWLCPQHHRDRHRELSAA